MGAMQRRKGAEFERTVAKELFERLGIDFNRNLKQYQTSGQGDLTTDAPGWGFSIECKHCNTANLPAWRRQAVEAARATDQLPCVIYRVTRGPIRVSVPLRAFCDAWPSDEWAEITLDGFCLLAREIMAESAAWQPNDYRRLRDQIVGEGAE
ncbi:hypothetical protein Q0601_00805 [Paracoccus onubensis]|uniref:putative PDDEXK endonuclease n=1 Tax=Paracoccus onubensis TaxID=1675788 RepID=UPI00273029F8|nr:hypothetical protein [Paracoccus onubensis]MDP0925701.1 hypothetical protein [Paracoccus onubensis]